MIIHNHQELINAPRHMPLPFALALKEGDVTVKEILRFSPGKRITAIGQYQEQDVVVKIFFDNKNAELEYQRDSQGVKILIENNIPTATLFYDGPAQIPGVYVMILEYLKDAVILKDFWRSLSEKEKNSNLHYLLDYIAELHKKGVLQQDMHFHNFLVDNKNFYPIPRFYALDGSDIFHYPTALNLKQSMNNLAGFIAQIATQDIPSFTEMITYYCQRREYPLTTFIFNEFKEKLSLIRQQRDKLCMDKIWRDCSEFSFKKEKGFVKIWKREKNGKEFLSYLQQSGNYLPSEKEYLHYNSDETAMKCVFDEESLVIKEFQSAPIKQQIKEYLPRSRAAKAWQNAHQLLQWEINTPKPRAFMEKSQGIFKGNSYYLYEYLPGKTFLDFFKDVENESTISAYISKFVTLLKNLHGRSLAYDAFEAKDIILSEENFYFINVENISLYQSFVELKTSQKKALLQFLQSLSENARLKTSLEKTFLEEGLL